MQITMRSAVPLLMIIVAAASLVAIGYPSVPQYSTATDTSIFASTDIHPQAGIYYAYSTVTCLATPSTQCYVLISPYTSVETWSAEITETVLLFSASTRYAPYAFSGLTGTVALVGLLIILVAGILILVRKR